MRARVTGSLAVLARRLLLALLAVALAGCFYVQPPNQAFGTRVGPAPHAPAHGYRHKQTGHPDLVYDSRLGVYLVLGYPDHFHDGGLYFRVVSGRWQSSSRLHGAWKRCSVGDLPRGLAARHARSRSKTVPASPRR